MSSGAKCCGDVQREEGELGPRGAGCDFLIESGRISLNIRHLMEIREQAMLTSEIRACQAEGKANAMSLRQECAWCA